jgi:tetratricopeptide (TPR) repeat protein
LEWARKHARYSRSEWGQAYSSIRYRMDMAMNHKSIYEKYTLAEIRQKGGICGDQAYFASVTAKASGVPAMIITGWGDRGPHAWFGYEATARDWNLKSGRYPGDKYPAGQTIDPQTRQKIKEPMLELLTDPQRRQAPWKTATRLVWLAEILNKHGQPQEAREALETAVAVSSRHLVAWQALCNTLKQAEAPPVKMQEQFRVMRTTFARYPDVLATINELEIGVLKSGTNTTALTEAAKRQFRDLQSHGLERTDLQIENIKKQAALLVNAGKIDDADKVYRRGFQDQSRSIGWFRNLFPSYVEFARANQRLKEAAKFLSTELRRLPQPGGDPFAQKNYAQTERDLAVVFEETGQKSTANSLRQDALHSRSAPPVKLVIKNF